MQFYGTQSVVDSIRHGWMALREVMRAWGSQHQKTSVDGQECVEFRVESVHVCGAEVRCSSVLKHVVLLHFIMRVPFWREVQEGLRLHPLRALRLTVPSSSTVEKNRTLTLPHRTPHPNPLTPKCWWGSLHQWQTWNRSSGLLFDRERPVLSDAPQWEMQLSCCVFLLAFFPLQLKKTHHTTPRHPPQRSSTPALHFPFSPHFQKRLISL